MKKNTDNLQPDTYYHIYNRGINGTRIFTKKGNTDYFLQKYIKYIQPIADTYAYVLMGNHFHFLIKTKSEAEVKAFYQNYKNSKMSNTGVPNVGIPNVGEVRNLADVTTTTDIPTYKILSNQFAKLFNSYAQAINKQDKRSGGLFEEPFRRISIDSEVYAAHLVYYIHHNPKKHGFIDDFQGYPFSSYPIFLDHEPTFIQRKEVISWFGGLEPFLIYHGTKHDFDEKWYEKNWIEVD